LVLTGNWRRDQGIRGTRDHRAVDRHAPHGTRSS
jgi:hypothetical protein